MNVFCTRKIAKAGTDLIEAAGHHLKVWPKDLRPTTQELIEACRNQDALIVADGNKISAEFLEACSHLKIIAVHSVGYNHVDLATAKKLHIHVGNTPKAGSRETADTSFLLMIAVSKKAFYMHRKIFKGEWKHFEPTENLGIGLRGKTLGIFGLGEIGFEMARLSQAAFNMNIIYHNRHHNQKAESLLGAHFTTFEELLTESDVLSVHAALTSETRHKFDAAAFSKMKNKAIFINCARGGIHDEKALTAAIENQQIFGAGLDVTHPEPMNPNSRLLRLPTVAVTPHIGNAIDSARDEMAVKVAENIIAAGDGKPIPYEVK